MGPCSRSSHCTEVQPHQASQTSPGIAQPSALCSLGHRLNGRHPERVSDVPELGLPLAPLPPVGCHSQDEHAVAHGSGSHQVVRPQLPAREYTSKTLVVERTPTCTIFLLGAGLPAMASHSGATLAPTSLI